MSISEEMNTLSQNAHELGILQGRLQVFTYLRGKIAPKILIDAIDHFSQQGESYAAPIQNISND